MTTYNEITAGPREVRQGLERVLEVSEDDMRPPDLLRDGLRRPSARVEAPVPGAALLGEDDTHVVCDALTEVRVRYLKQAGRPLDEIACEVYERHVDGLITHRELQTLAAAGAECLAADGLPAWLAARYERSPGDTRVLLGFLALVRETYGYEPST